MSHGIVTLSLIINSVWNNATGSCETWGCSAVPQCGTCNGSICVGCYGNYFLSGG